MGRLDARCNVQVPVTLILDDRHEGSKQQAFTSNLGLRGAYINFPDSLPEKSLVRLKAHLPSCGEFEISSKILRSEDSGVAVKFVDLDQPAKATLWKYIKEELPRGIVCPYCGEDNQDASEKCGFCGLSINFDTDTYLASHELEIQEKLLSAVEFQAEDLIRDLEDIEAMCGSADEDQAYINSRINEISDAFFSWVERFEIGVQDEKIVKELRAHLREKTKEHFAKSYFFSRAQTWPLGYQGDYKMLENIYRNMPLSPGIGKYMDMYFLDSLLSRAVRSRIKWVENMLRKEIGRRKSPSVLNMVCGSCRELIVVTPEISASKAAVTCIDNNYEALTFAQKRLSFTDASPLVTFRKYNALRMFDHDLNMREFGKQDLIYSLGFFNYLNSEFLIKMLASLYRLLNDGGKIVTAFMDAGRYRSHECHWLINWDGFLQRNEGEFREVFKQAGIPHDAVTEDREETGVIVFYTIAK